MLPLLLALPAHALDFSLDTTIEGASESWTIEDVRFGSQEPFILEGPRKTRYRIEVELSEHESGVRYAVRVVELTRSRRGAVSEAVLSQPVLIAALDQEATVTWGARGAPSVELSMVTR